MSLLAPALLCVVLAAPSSQNPPAEPVAPVAIVEIGGQSLTESPALVASDTVRLAEPDRNGPQETKGDARENKPPAPEHTGFRALLTGLKNDITHLPSK